MDVIGFDETPLGISAVCGDSNVEDACSQDLQ